MYTWPCAPLPISSPRTYEPTAVFRREGFGSSIGASEVRRESGEGGRRWRAEGGGKGREGSPADAPAPRPRCLEPTDPPVMRADPPARPSRARPRPGAARSADNFLFGRLKVIFRRTVVVDRVMTTDDNWHIAADLPRAGGGHGRRRDARGARRRRGDGRGGAEPGGVGVVGAGGGDAVGGGLREKATIGGGVGFGSGIGPGTRRGRRLRAARGVAHGSALHPRHGGDSGGERGRGVRGVDRTARVPGTDRERPGMDARCVRCIVRPSTRRRLSSDGRRLRVRLGVASGVGG